MARLRYYLAILALLFCFNIVIVFWLVPVSRYLPTTQSPCPSAHTCPPCACDTSCPVTVPDIRALCHCPPPDPATPLDLDPPPVKHHQKGSGPPVNDTTPFKGYVISTKRDRYEHSAKILRACGIEPTLHPVVPLTAPVLLDEKHFLKADSVSTVVSNKYSHRSVMQRIAYDPSLSDNDWYFVFEDDVALMSPLQPSQVPNLLHAAIKEAQSVGFFYMGLCAPQCEGARKDIGSGVSMQRCTGRCMHSYAVSKWRAAWLYDELSLRLHDVKYVPASAYHYIDVLFHYAFQTYAVDQWPLLVGSGLVSPQDWSHVGIIYQDRNLFASEMGPM